MLHRHGPKWVSDTTHEVIEYKKINDYTIFSAIWTVFITSATVGYGDQIPTTSKGRTVLFFAGLLGIITAGLLTATIIVELSWTSTEQVSIIAQRRSLLSLTRLSLSLTHSLTLSLSVRVCMRACVRACIFVAAQCGV